MHFYELSSEHILGNYQTIMTVLFQMDVTSLMVTCRPLCLYVFQRHKLLLFSV